jgi:FkbM family methyltransferase
MHRLNGFARYLPGSLKRDVRRAAFQVLDLKWHLRSGLRIQVASLSDWIIFNEIFVNGDYDAAILMAFERAQTQAKLIVLDLGANVGFFTLRCIDLLRGHDLYDLETRITAVEGNPKTHRDLLARLSMQDRIPPVNAIHGLVGRRAGRAGITDFEIGGNNRVVVGEHEKPHVVDYIDLERLPDMQSRIDLLKCDIEGGELLFIQNYRDLLQRTEVAVFELHDDQCDTQECLGLLQDAGFEHTRKFQRDRALRIVHAWR